MGAVGMLMIDDDEVTCREKLIEQWCNDVEVVYLNDGCMLVTYGR